LYEQQHLKETECSTSKTSAEKKHRDVAESESGTTKGKNNNAGQKNTPNTCEPLLSIKETAREVGVAVSECKEKNGK